VKVIEYWDVGAGEVGIREFQLNLWTELVGGLGFLGLLLALWAFQWEAEEWSFVGFVFDSNLSSWNSLTSLVVEKALALRWAMKLLWQLAS